MLHSASEESIKAGKAVTVLMSPYISPHLPNPDPGPDPNPDPDTNPNPNPSLALTLA